jgi:hypothetical protein
VNDALGGYANREQCKELMNRCGATSCAFCCWFDQHEPATTYLSAHGVSAEMTGHCRRRSPVVIDNEEDGFWPVVQSWEWCGEFQPSAGDRGLGFFCMEEWLENRTGDVSSGEIEAGQDQAGVVPAEAVRPDAEVELRWHEQAGD